jgi:hypothetical protein
MKINVEDDEEKLIKKNSCLFTENFSHQARVAFCDINRY